MEEFLIVMWCIWQTLRMILIAKKQKMAHQQAKTLINFENIIVDTDFGGAVSFRASVLGGYPGIGKANDSGEQDHHEVFEMGSFDTDPKSKGKNSQKSGKKSKDNIKQIEMKNLNKMHHYVIDDEISDDEDEVQPNEKKKSSSPSKTNGNRPAREIVFDADDL